MIENFSSSRWAILPVWQGVLPYLLSDDFGEQTSNIDKKSSQALHTTPQQLQVHYTQAWEMCKRASEQACKKQTPHFSHSALSTTRFSPSTTRRLLMTFHEIFTQTWKTEEKNVVEKFPFFKVVCVVDVLLLQLLRRRGPATTASFPQKTSVARPIAVKNRITRRQFFAAKKRCV